MCKIEQKVGIKDQKQASVHRRTKKQGKEMCAGKTVTRKWSPFSHRLHTRIYSRLSFHACAFLPLRKGPLNAGPAARRTSLCVRNECALIWHWHNVTIRSAVYEDDVVLIVLKGKKTNRVLRVVVVQRIKHWATLRSAKQLQNVQIGNEIMARRRTMAWIIFRSTSHPEVFSCLVHEFGGIKSGSLTQSGCFLGYWESWFGFPVRW